MAQPLKETPFYHLVRTISHLMHNNPLQEEVQLKLRSYLPFDVFQEVFMTL